jgi:hypothetical protein
MAVVLQAVLGVLRVDDHPADGIAHDRRGRGDAGFRPVVMVVGHF